MQGESFPLQPLPSCTNSTQNFLGTGTNSCIWRKKSWAQKRQLGTAYWAVWCDEIMTHIKAKKCPNAYVYAMQLTSFGVFLSLRPDVSEGPLPGSGDGIADREAGKQVPNCYNCWTLQEVLSTAARSLCFAVKTLNTPFQANTKSQSEAPNCFTDAPMLCQSTASQLGLLSCISSTLSSHIKAHSVLSRCNARNCFTKRKEEKMWSRMFWSAQFAFRLSTIFLRSIIITLKKFGSI